MKLPEWFLDAFPGTDQGFYTMAYLTRKFDMKIDSCKHVFVAMGYSDAYGRDDWRLGDFEVKDLIFLRII